MNTGFYQMVSIISSQFSIITSLSKHDLTLQVPLLMFSELLTGYEYLSNKLLISGSVDYTQAQFIYWVKFPVNFL